MSNTWTPLCRWCRQVPRLREGRGLCAVCLRDEEIIVEILEKAKTKPR